MLLSSLGRTHIFRVCNGKKKKKKTFDHSYSFISIEFSLELALAIDFGYSATFTRELNILDAFCVFASCICST